MDDVDNFPRPLYSGRMASEPIELQYLTVPEAAALLEMSVGGVQKAIQRGRLPAIRVSPRRTRITRLAVEAYRTRGSRLPIEPTTDVAEMRRRFEAEAGMSAREWQDAWRRGAIAETAQAYRLGSASLMILAIEAEEAQASSGPATASVAVPRREPSRHGVGVGTPRVAYAREPD